MMIMMLSTIEYLAKINPEFTTRFLADMPKNRTREGISYVILEEPESYKEKQQS
jgi:hypothetical protein